MAPCPLSASCAHAAGPVHPGGRPRPPRQARAHRGAELDSRRIEPGGPGRVFQSFDEGHAVQYFYEPFLHAFDPELRKELGVWYTPDEIVRYQVERVDAVLRSELGLADGLADPRVVVLDPCCGTGAYLRAVLRRIRATLHEKGGDALVAHDLKKAAMERIFDFEILPAPFVIAHLQLALELETLGAPLSDRSDPPERAGVYLTNALTGWEPPKEKPKQIAFPGFDDERDAAGKVKQEKPILVILGNPPYNGYAGVAVAEERDLSTAYRSTKRAPAPQGQGLNDLYVRFFRMADRRIVEKGGKGVICFISNYSWLDGLSFTGMRERYLEVFDRIDIDCLNGDKYKTGKLTPEGEPDPSIFSTDLNREGIQLGTAIATLVKVGADLLPHGPRPKVANRSICFRHFWGRNKRTELLAGKVEFCELTPVLEMDLCFTPGQVAAEYVAWPQLPDLFPVSFPGVKTSRDHFLVDVDRDGLLARLEQYFDPNVSHEEMRRTAPGVMENTARFRSEIVRDTLRRRGFLRANIVHYAYRPFDVRWLYWEPETKLLDEKRSESFPQVFAGNRFIVTQQRPRREWSMPQVIRPIGCLDLMDRGGSCFPLLFHPGGREGPVQCGDRIGQHAATEPDTGGQGVSGSVRHGAGDAVLPPRSHAACSGLSARERRRPATGLAADSPAVRKRPAPRLGHAGPPGRRAARYRKAGSRRDGGKDPGGSEGPRGLRSR